MATIRFLQEGDTKCNWHFWIKKTATPAQEFSQLAPLRGSVRALAFIEIPRLVIVWIHGRRLLLT
jgi:hypothetical protein